jgi:hypothetical protein
MAVVTAVFRWARYGAWALLGGGFVVLVASAAWGRAWGPVAVALIATGYTLGVIAVLPIVGQTLRAAVEAVARRTRPRGSHLH